ncbi:MAG TPA: PilN domain-containing protein [Fimbriimonadaceae bacterium]|nr:PilN domain-containing protein [Fimbriimonadaceae bacterium]
MPLINLIQEQRLTARRNERRARAFFLAFAGTACASLASFGYFLFHTEQLQGEESRLQAMLAKTDPILKAIEENEKVYGTLAPRLKTLEDAQTMTSRWDRITEHLAVQTPQPLWLTGIRCIYQDPTKPIQVSFIGVSDRQDNVGEFILRLQNLPDLEGVNLKFTQEKVIAQGRGIEFEVSANLAGTVEQKVQEEKPEA